jgi:pimeloyl-ACP methyl ester carboxylesterase
VPAARSVSTLAADEILLHGHRVRFHRAGSGPLVVLLHGIASTADTWAPVAGALARRHTVLAPDLLGHGESAKPRGDYSLGAYASGVRDLVAALGYDRATVVGHSLGGGIAMQFAYQFPERTDRMVLMSSGGLGEEVHVLLRAGTLPGSELVLPILASRHVRDVVSAIGKGLGALHLKPGPDVSEMARGIGSLAESDARSAFLHTLRGVIDHGGQRVSALDRLHLTEDMPSMVIWGERDPIIPVKHGRAAHGAMPRSRLELLPGAGHFPQLEQPIEVAGLLTDFMESTEPANLVADDMRDSVMRAS